MNRKRVKKLLRRTGYDLRRYQPGGTYLERRMSRIEAAGIDQVIDVGAHAGEYAGSLRHEGYRGAILSFEPQQSMFQRLSAAAVGDPLWQCRQQAVGSEPGTMSLHISGNEGFSSSLRPMTEAHEHGDPSSAYVDTEEVEITTLDTAVEAAADSRLFLKVDVQGHEAEALAGGHSTLARCQIVEMELGLVELYEGQALFTDLIEAMKDLGFLVADLEPAFSDTKTDRLLQVDALFIHVSK